MVKKELQEQRIKQYFIDATIEIIKGEGIKAVNVRTISERAGYSFGTLYNYFKDLNELLSICIDFFIDECISYVNKNIQKANNSESIILDKTLYFVKYFVQYTGIYELLFIERSNDIGAKEEVVKKIGALLDMILEDDWNIIIEANPDKIELIKIKRSIYKSTVYDTMFWYFNRRVITDYLEFNNKIKSECKYILGS